MPSHIYEKPKSTSPFNVPVATGENARKKFDLPKNIGFRGRHAHGKAPDDPVYPTRQLTSSPKLGFVDWRTGGRALLVTAMAAIEGKVLRTRRAIMKWQMFPTCSPQCGWSCHRARNRVLCAWFTPGTVHEHFTRMAGLQTMFKGSKLVSIADPPFRPMSRVADRNRYNAVPMELVNGDWKRIGGEVDAAFGIRDDMRRIQNPREGDTNGYDSDEDKSGGGYDLTQLDAKSKSEAEFINRTCHF